MFFLRIKPHPGHPASITYFRGDIQWQPSRKVSNSNETKPNQVEDKSVKSAALGARRSIERSACQLQGLAQQMQRDRGCGYAGYEEAA